MVNCIINKTSDRHLINKNYTITKMNSKKKVILEDYLIFEESQTKIFKENDGKLYFENAAKNSKAKLCTNNYLEAVACLMKMKDLYKSELWDIKITGEMRKNINYYDVLYWLTGGDREWKYGNTYNVKWSGSRDIFLNSFDGKLKEINGRCGTLGEVRMEFLRHFNLPIMYNYCIENNII